ncbi:hypothetical protein ACLKA7_008310 [Drosophila subpalustris]
MPESDVTKMKVADLKRELKMRGLPLNGNKNELQDRLQTALLEGDISLEDSAIADAIADGKDDDFSLTDEDEHKLLGDDHEDLLLKSPVSTPTASTATLPELLTATSPSTQSKPETTIASPPAKKIVLKRNNSQQHLTSLNAASTTTSKENAAPKAETSNPVSDTEEKSTKPQRKPIVVGGSETDNKDATKGANKKLGELSIQERLELRAKKFGITADANASAKAAAASPAVNKSSSASIKANNGNKETDEQQKEALKRRAERFGCVVPEKSAKTSAVTSAGDEKLQKRKERFGGAAATADAAAPAVSDSKGQGDWAEKARARLERFKVTAAAAPETAK